MSEEEKRHNDEEEIRYSTNDARFVLRRDQYTPGCWVQGGTLECFASVGWALIKLAELRGIPTNPNTMEVEKVRAARIGRQSHIWIHPTLPTDPEGTLVKRDKQGHMTINFYKFLAREKLLIAVGKRERFELSVVTGPDSPVGPALRLDFSAPVDTRVIPAKKKEA